MKKLSEWFRIAGWSSVGCFIGFCIYDCFFNPAYIYGSAPLWLYIASRLFTFGLLGAAFFTASHLLKKRAKSGTHNK